MAILPLFNKPQVQSITNVLKNICRDYPAGGAILRELLQNADDAGASIVKFVLDDNYYETEPLLHPELAQYQGPALLAFNSAKFLDKDFESLSRVGDSLKFSDGATTGRFGRGFNSVYNWTDSPSIVSRDRLLILDPHHACSSGGEIYDFVANAGEREIINHMAVFQKLLQPLDQPLDGTIIRIPMRTDVQALTSKISDRQIAVSEMSMVLERFADEFSNGGLVFMKHVTKISINSKITGDIGIEVCNFEEVVLHKNMVNNAIINSLNDKSFSFKCTFELITRYAYRGKITQTSFMVNHNIDGQAMSQEILEWSRNRKFAPWVAIAIKLSGGSDSVRNGSLFNVMPLHIPINQPAFIHGLFSISPDRARLYKAHDSSLQDELPAKWNEWLFNESIPHAWTNLLYDFASLFPEISCWEYWPHMVKDYNCFSKDVLAKVLSLIQKNNLPLFHTHIGYVTAADGLLATGSESEELSVALLAAKIPVFFVPDPLKSELEDIFENGALAPKTLCQFLDHKNAWVMTWNGDTRQAILEYILFVLASSEYGKTLELLPFEDGQRRSLNAHTVFVHRNDFEAELFRHDTERNLDISRFSLTVADALKRSLLMPHDHKQICHRSAEDLRSYALKYEFQQLGQSSDMVVLNLDQVTFVTKIWSWMFSQNLDFFNEQFGSLWLLPVTNGRYRKVKPLECWAIFPPSGAIGDIARKLGEPDGITLDNQVLLTSKLGPEQASLSFMQTIKAGATLQIHDGEKLHILLAWLGKIHATIERLSDTDKYVILEHIARQLRKSNDSQYIPDNLFNLRNLPIFRSVMWDGVANYGSIPRTWVRLDSRVQIGVDEKIATLPIFTDFQFLDAQAKEVRQILQYQGLGVCKSAIKIIEGHILPAWKSNQECIWASFTKEATAELMLRSYSDLSMDARMQIATLPIIPTQRINGTITLKFSTASTLIDPSIPEMREIFFEEEEVLPTDAAYEKFGFIYKSCGLKSTVDEALAYDRARKFESSGYRPVEEVRSRALKLFDFQFLAPGPKNINFRDIKWLPVTLPDYNQAMRSPNKCRDTDDSLHVCFELPILQLKVSASWRKYLGWDKALPPRILLSQLNKGIMSNNRAVVDAVLTYLNKHSQVRGVSNELCRLRCVLTENDTFVTSPKAFFTGCSRLHPWLGTVDKTFRNNHENFLSQIGVGCKPAEKDLLNVQSQIEQGGYPLNDTDIEVLLEIVTLACDFDRPSLKGLKVLDQDQILCPLEDITYNDEPLVSNTLVEKVRFTDSRISKDIASKLFIEPISERLSKGILQLADDKDDEEFFQREKIATSISDTLDRYPVSSTFKEYLANADDVEGATELHFFLDQRFHATQGLLTVEMDILQGPALLIQNDGVFSENDFEGLKDIGRGSKRENKGIIGQFGRGAQTCFHWTDSPMILSGSFLLILDPLRKRLPFNYRHQKRKPGVKILLSKLRQSHPNQLAPFKNLWGYDLDSDYYDGTIFRFPLRKERSPLRGEKEPLSIEVALKHLQEFFDEARISLLFLRRINNITFRMHSSTKFTWDVKRKCSVPRLLSISSQWTTCSFKYLWDQETTQTAVGEDRWWVHLEVDEDSYSIPVQLRKDQARVTKSVECGIAALITSSRKASTDIEVLPTPKIFSTLPLPIISSLPVHIHATFSLPSDRQSLITSGESSESHGLEWNYWILKDRLVESYLHFLESLGQEIGMDVFKFWPTKRPPVGSCSEPLFASFWNALPLARAKLYPKAERNLDSNRQRFMEISDAVFDFFPPLTSKTLAPLIQILIPNLAAPFPPGFIDDISKRIEKMDNVTSVNGGMLRRLFKTIEASDSLQAAMKSNPIIINAILQECIPSMTTNDSNEQDSGLADLHGCKILPLDDRSLGKLSFLAKVKPLKSYYIADDTELDLFGFAASLFVSRNLDRQHDRIEILAESGKFNVSRLNRTHIPEIMTMRVDRPKNSTEEMDKWLKAF